MISFREIVIDDAKKILDWRTSERITKFLNSDMSYDVDAQKRWLEGSFNKSNYYHWIIQHGGEDVGLLNFVDWNREDKTTSWGFYIGEESALGLGGLVPPYFYNFAFDKLSVDKILAEVFYNNTSVITTTIRPPCSMAVYVIHSLFMHLSYRYIENATMKFGVMVHLLQYIFLTSNLCYQ